MGNFSSAARVGIALLLLAVIGGGCYAILTLLGRGPKAEVRVARFQQAGLVEGSVRFRRPGFVAVYHFAPSEATGYALSSRMPAGTLVGVTPLLSGDEEFSISVAAPYREVGDLFEAYAHIDDGDGVFDAARDQLASPVWGTAFALALTPAERATAALKARYPELAGFGKAALPPTSIKTERSGTTWHAAFITSGSGIDSILSASCYSVSDSGTMQKTGTFARGSRDVRSLSARTCRPL